jgi:hypothetical protein
VITGPRSLFEARCRERGYTLEQVRPCIVSQDGDRLVVDETHPAYPRAEPGVSLVQQAVNFVTSAAKHVAAGMPRATDEQVAERFSICQGCEFYDGKACTKCGCPVVREKQFVSKLAWADSECPVGKWGKDAKKAVDNQ